MSRSVSESPLGFEITRFDCIRLLLMPLFVSINIQANRTVSGYIITCETACGPSDGIDQPVHPRSLIRVFPGRSLGIYS